jgi:hypothetical protein
MCGMCERAEGVVGEAIRDRCIPEGLEWFAALRRPWAPGRAVFMKVENLGT